MLTNSSRTRRARRCPPQPARAILRAKEIELVRQLVEKKGSGAPATASDLESLTIKARTRADAVDLSAAERKFLQHSDWITEDEADATIAERICRREAGLAKPFREYLRERGITVDGPKPWE
jgi:hypothetical protein